MIESLFIPLLLVCCGYAAGAGGKDGRWIAAMLVFAMLLSIPAGSLRGAWHQLQLPVLGIDLLLLAGLLWVALRTRAYWPLWLTAFHLLSVTSHIATIAEPRIEPFVYFSVSTFWSLPGLLVMVAGIMRDRRTFGSAADGRPEPDRTWRGAAERS